MRIFITAVLVFVNFILQTTLFPLFSIRGILPNTALIIVTSYALLRGSREGALVGVASGLLQDIFFCTSIGFYSGLFLLFGFLIGRSQRNFYRENYLLPILFCTVSASLFEIILYITGYVFRGEGNLLYFFFRILLPEAVYTAIITIPIYRILFGINEWLELKEKYKYRLF